MKTIVHNLFINKMAAASKIICIGIELNLEVTVDVVKLYI